MAVCSSLLKLANATLTWYARRELQFCRQLIMFSHVYEHSIASAASFVCFPRAFEHSTDSVDQRSRSGRCRERWHQAPCVHWIQTEAHDVSCCTHTTVYYREVEIHRWAKKTRPLCISVNI